MATGTNRFGAGRSQLRQLVSEYVDLIGPGGLTAYVSHQDLLIITDFNSMLVLRDAHKYVRPYKLRAVAEYARVRRELPGAHILQAAQDDHPADIRYKSTISDKSIYVMDLIALADAQSEVDLEMRHRLDRQYKAGRDPSPIRTLTHSSGINVLVGDNYYNTLLSSDRIRILSGVYDGFAEPTKAWRNLPISEKGVFFLADRTFYGLVMPHAKVNVSTRDGGN